MECPKCKEESDYKIERDNEVIFRCGNKSCTVMVFVSKSAWRGSYNAKYCYCFVHWFVDRILLQKNDWEGMKKEKGLDTKNKMN